MATGSERNKSCPCGSGKKYKKCCLKTRKERKIAVTVDMGEEGANGIKITPNGEIEFFRNNISALPESATIEAGYDRKKGQKVLNKAPLVNEKLVADLNRALLKYDRIYAIDTNTKPFKDAVLSVSAIILCQLYRQEGFSVGQYAPVHCFEFRNIEEKPENIAWKKLIEMLSSHPAYKKLGEIGIVVDSDLGNIPDYNAGIKPITNNFYLPDNVTLIYASADAGKEYLPNKLITVCDKEANKLIRQIQATPDNTADLQAMSDVPYTHFRLWNCS